MSSAPFPPRRRQESLSLSKVLWIFPKRQLDKHETAWPSSLRRFVFCQIIRSNTRKIFSSRLPYQESLCIAKGALRVRGSVSLSLEEVLLLNFSRRLSQTCIHLSSIRHFFLFLSFQNDCPTCVRQNAVALVACDAVNALPLVETRVGGTFVDVGLAVRACGRCK